MAETRKIAAILAADVVGFSRLTGADEDGTLARLRTLRAEHLDPTVLAHRGRVFKRTGDGLLVEFRSVVDALHCALELQAAMPGRNVGLPPDRRIEFRIGLHLGRDRRRSRRRSDGRRASTSRRGSKASARRVASASRARPTIRVRDRLEDPVVDLGERELKNIRRPVRAYLAGPGPGTRPGRSHDRSTPGGGDRSGVGASLARGAAVPKSRAVTADTDYFADGVVRGHQSRP